MIVPKYSVQIGLQKFWSCFCITLSSHTTFKIKMKGSRAFWRRLYQDFTLDSILENTPKRSHLELSSEGLRIILWVVRSAILRMQCLGMGLFIQMWATPSQHRCPIELNFYNFLIKISITKYNGRCAFWSIRLSSKNICIIEIKNYWNENGNT